MPICFQNPQDDFHVILDCTFTNQLWADIDPILKLLNPKHLTDEEKAFGITQKKSTTDILLRNWITYLLRECITLEERNAFHRKPSLENVKRRFNRTWTLEIKKNILRYEKENKLEYFEKIVTDRDVLCTKTTEGEYQITQVFS